MLTSPFQLLKSNHLGVILTFAVYNTNLPHDATEEERLNATIGYLGASYDMPSLVEKLLQQLASKQTISVNVYDTTNASSVIKMYGSEVGDMSEEHISSLDFGDPFRKHEMHCRFRSFVSAPLYYDDHSVFSLSAHTYSGFFLKTGLHKNHPFLG